jgi:hypothetical protein
MSVAVLAQLKARRQRPGLRRALTGAASVLMHVVVFGGMAHMAARDKMAQPSTPPPPTIIQVEIQRREILPEPPLRLPQPTPIPTPPRPAERERQIPAPAEAPPRPAPAAAAPQTPAPVPAAAETPRPAAPAQVPAPALAPPAAAPERAPAAPAVVAPIIRRKKDEDEGREGAPAPPAPRLANPAAGAPSAAASGVAGVSDAWRVAPESQADANARALRTSPAGCPATQMLRNGEKLICDERYNERAAEGAERGRITGTGNAGRDARFAREGAREMQRYEESRRPPSGSIGIIGPRDCPGSNLGSGCAGDLLDPSMRMDSTQNIRTSRDGPATSATPAPRPPARRQ